MSESKILDWLADKALTAIEKKSPHLGKKWFLDKRYQLTGKSRLEILSWTVFDLDDNNKSIVAEALDVSIDDLDAVRRVLRKI